MKTFVIASIAALAVAGAAAAQPRGPSITLYEGPSYQGQSRTFGTSVDNLADQGFNDRSQSLRVQGRWRVCEDAHLRGRCVEVSGDVPNLNALNLTGQISSFESLDRAPQYGGGYDRRPYEGGGGYDRGPYAAGGGGFDRGPYDRDDRRDFAGPRMDGAGVSFFPRPQPGPYRDAQEFCRRMGFSGVAYADGRGREIRDVVCRR
jgi:hypothetical protein